MQVEYAQQYRRLWEEHWWWRSREAFVLGTLNTIVNRLKVGRILDVGCGDGLFFAGLSQFGAVDGLESDAAILSSPSRRSRIRVGRLDRSFRPGSVYDLVVMLDVLEHIEDDLEALQSAREALQPGGRILITVPALRWLWSRHDEVNQHFRRYSLEELRARLVEAGFEVDNVRFFFAWTVVPLLFRRWLKPATSDESGMAEGDYEVGIPSRPVNGVLKALSRVDHWLASRIRWPLGSSLIAVARRSPANDMEGGAR